MDHRFFQLAKACYHECEEIIEEVEGRFYLLHKLPNTPPDLPKFQAEIAMRQFDYGLQMTLYAVASTVNGVIATKNQLTDQNDIDFIKNIVNHGDVFAHKIVEAQTNMLGIPISVGWNTLMMIPPQGLISLMIKYVQPLVKDCIGCVVLSDSFIGKSGREATMFQLENRVRRIAEHFCSPNDEIANIMTWIRLIWMNARLDFEKKFHQ